MECLADISIVKNIINVPSDTRNVLTGDLNVTDSVYEENPPESRRKFIHFYVYHVNDAHTKGATIAQPHLFTFGVGTSVSLFICSNPLILRLMNISVLCSHYITFV